MPTCEENTVSSNSVTLALAEETCLKQLPTQALFTYQQVNSFSDTGGKITTVARNPLSPNRNPSRGSVTDIEVTGGFQSDITMTNFDPLIKSFLFCDSEEVFETTAVITDATTITADSLTGINITIGSLVFFPDSALQTVPLKVTAIADKVLTVAGAVVGETQSQKMLVIGLDDMFDVSAETNHQFTLTTGTQDTDLTKAFVKNDLVYLKDGQVMGYCSVMNVTATVLSLKSVDGISYSAGTAADITVYRARTYNNGLTRRSYCMERAIKRQYDTQYQYINGAVPNTLSITMPTANKITADYAFVACDEEFRDGSQSEPRKDGTFSEYPDAPALNTTSDIKMAMLLDSDNQPLLEYLTEVKLDINNNITPTKAISIFGALDANVGMFNLKATVTGYFSSVASNKAIRNNEQCSLFVILEKDKVEMAFYLPVLTLSNGMLTIAENTPITIPLDCEASVDNEKTMSYGKFDYFPTV